MKQPNTQTFGVPFPVVPACLSELANWHWRQQLRARHQLQAGTLRSVCARLQKEDKDWEPGWEWQTKTANLSV